MVSVGGSSLVKIYIHGNCQAPALAGLLSEALPASTQVSSRQVYDVDLALEGKAYENDIRTADVILTQPVTPGYRGTEILSTPWIVENAKPDAKVLLFPVAYHRGQIPQSFPLPELLSGRLAYHDAHAVDFFLRGESVEAFVDATSASDFLPKAFVQSEMMATTMEMLRREHAIRFDVTIMDIIASEMMTTQPLLTVNHPQRSIMVQIANRLLPLLNRPERVELQGAPILDHYIVAPYLSTALGLGHHGTDLRMDEVGYLGAWETRQTFYEAVFEEYRRAGRDALLSAMSRSDLPKYLKRFRASKAAGFTSNDRLLIEGLYQAFFGRAAESHEVLHHLRTLEHAGLPAVLHGFTSTLFKVPGAIDALKVRAEGPSPGAPA